MGYAPGLAFVLDRVSEKVSWGFENTVNEDLLRVLCFGVRHEIDCHVTYMHKECNDYLIHL